ncbi:MAG TPA: DUF1080 domain-containing protein [Opitutaceae bacterium]|nr:DUF1080 domain-containing protein [Opitutaceae bacterium]
MNTPSTSRVARRMACAGFLVLATSLTAGPWQSLFNGKDLRGWKVVESGGKAPYTVEKKAIVGTTVAGTPNSFLATEQTYGDFILEYEVKQEGATNSGVQIRSQSRPDYQNGRVHGWQVEIDPSARAWSGGLYEEARRGWYYPGSALNPAARGAYKPGEWNRFRVEAIGPSIRTWVNGIPVAHVVDDLDRAGFIALQVHSIGRNDEPGKRILWRNIRIQTKDLKPSPPDALFVRNNVPNTLTDAEKAQGWKLLFDGQSAAGWRGVGKEQFPEHGWKIESGELVVVGKAGPDDRSPRGGDIVTTEHYGAFELQFDFQVTPGGNSGVKYYVQEAGRLGLEYQLLDDEKHPDAKMGAGGNRTTGSLYDLIPRENMPGGANIPPKPGTWQHGRIVARADGSVEHWLNGIKVVEYNRNSRLFAALVARSKFEKNEGFGRLEKGPILLQDHGDEVRFRSIKIRVL